MAGTGLSILNPKPFLGLSVKACEGFYEGKAKSTDLKSGKMDKSARLHTRQKYDNAIFRNGIIQDDPGSIKNQGSKSYRIFDETWKV